MLWSYLIWKKELRFIETAESIHNGLMKNCSCPREIKEMDPIVMSMPISQTKKCFENYGYTLCPWWPEEIFRLSNWLMMFHCVWTSKDLLFFMHWFTFWFCHLQVFFMYDVFALWYLSVQVFDFSSSCTQHQNRADTTQSFLRPKENYTLQVSQIRPIKHWNWYFLHWNARQIVLIE